MQIYLFHALIKQIIRYFSKVVVPRKTLCPQNFILERFLFLKGMLSYSFCVSLHHVTKNKLRIMEYQALSESAQMKANAKKRSIYINKVDSGMPRWLIELGFVLFVAQAVCTENSINNWIESHGMEIPRSVVFLIGDFILYYGMMVGMKPLRRPFTTLWWILIVLDMAGNITFIASDSIINLVLAIANPLAFLPLGFAIAFFYRGWLQWVGILMVGYMVTMIILPIMLYPFLPILLVDIIAIAGQIAFGWSMRRVLV